MTERATRQNPAITEFILRNIEAHPDSIGTLTAKTFRLSRTTVSNYIKKLISQKLILATGNTTARVYKLAYLSQHGETIKISSNTHENDVWRQYIRPHIKSLPQNVLDICQYGFTEMFNNVIDHSQTETASISIEQNYARISLVVSDNGIGIFQKIQKHFNLMDPREAILELSKGKLTSDKSRHSGEGIFFTSRMFGSFAILSHDLAYRKSHQKNDDGWLFEYKDKPDYIEGTVVSMNIPTNADWTINEIFEEYQDDDSRFSKTHVPLLLAKYGNEQLVSRSQAKRVLSRFEKFSEVILDFKGVEQIGQAFADEIFRIFANENPQIKMLTINASKDILRMIQHVSRRPDEQG